MVIIDKIALTRVIYTLVGAAGLWCATLLFRDSEEERTPYTA